MIAPSEDIVLHSKHCSSALSLVTKVVANDQHIENYCLGDIYANSR